MPLNDWDELEEMAYERHSHYAAAFGVWLHNKGIALLALVWGFESGWFWILEHEDGSKEQIYSGGTTPEKLRPDLRSGTVKEAEKRMRARGAEV